MDELQKAALMEKFYSEIGQLYQEAGQKASGEHQMEMTRSGRDGKVQKKVKKVGMFRKEFFMQHEDSQKRARIEKNLNGFLINKIGTTNVGALLITSLSDRISWIRDESTVLLNIMEAWARPDFIVDDWNYRISERRQGTIYATPINPETTLPGEQISAWTEKYNTLAFWGDPVSATFVGSAMLGRQRGIDILQKESESEMLRIRKVKNRDYIQSIEQKSYAPNQVPRVGGLLSRIESNVDTAGGGDVSELMLETNLAKIDAAIGINAQKICLSIPSQLRVIRDIAIDRYGGEHSESFYKMSQTYKDQLAAYKVVPDRYFESAVSGVVPFMREIDMAAGNIMCMTLQPDYIPLEARFLIGDEEGPWSWIRPIEELRELVMIMDGGTVDDPAEETRFDISDVA